MNIEFIVKKIDDEPFYKISDVPKVTMNKITDFFSFSLAKNLSKKTIRAYAYDLVVFFRFYKGKKKAFPSMKKIDVNVLIKFIQCERSRNAAPTSINRRLNTIDSFYRHCYNKNIPGTKIPGKTDHLRRQRYLTVDSKVGIYPIYSKGKNPFRVREVQKLARTLSPSEVKVFFQSLTTYRQQSIVLLMLICGLRSNEVVDLKLSDINVLESNIKVFGKGKKERIVPLDETINEILDKYIEEERPVKMNPKSSEYLFLSEKGAKRGRKMTTEGLRSLFRYRRMISGVKGANPHKFRHTFASNMAAAGISISVLQRLLGHSNFQTTLKYVNLSIEDIKEDFEKARKKMSAKYV